MKILLTGGAGYIGSHAARLLRRNGHQVVICDNLSTGHPYLANGFELVVGDISDRHMLARVLPGTDAVMHLAAHAYVGESVENPRKYFHNNAAAPLALFDAALDAGVRFFVLSSSCAVYGMPSRIPIPEDEPRRPISPYGISKLFCEEALEAYERAYGLRFVTLRYFNAAGADESGEIGPLHDPETRLIPLALAAAAGTGSPIRIFGADYETPDGTCIRDYVHVNDLAEAHLLALLHLKHGGSSLSFNLGAGKGHSIRQVLDAVRKVTGNAVPSRLAPRREGDPPVLVASTARARNVLGWTPARSLDDIIFTAWNWMQCRSSILASRPWSDARTERAWNQMAFR